MPRKEQEDASKPLISIQDRLKQIHEESMAMVMGKHGPYSQDKVNQVVKGLGLAETRECPICGHPFRPEKPEQYFCGDSCRAKRFVGGLVRQDPPQVATAGLR